MQNEPSAGPTQRSARGLDWFVFFVADIQTGFGPFVAVYPTEQKRTQIDIGLILTVSGVVALAGQMPRGATVGAARPGRPVAGPRGAGIAGRAPSYARMPLFLPVPAA